jgi:hypothetical protein
MYPLPRALPGLTSMEKPLTFCSEFEVAEQSAKFTQDYVWRQHGEEWLQILAGRDTEPEFL